MVKQDLVRVKSVITKVEKVVDRKVFNAWPRKHHKGSFLPNKGFKVIGTVTDQHLDDEAAKEKKAALEAAKKKQAEKEAAEKAEAEKKAAEKGKGKKETKIP